MNHLAVAFSNEPFDFLWREDEMRYSRKSSQRLLQSDSNIFTLLGETRLEQANERSDMSTREFVEAVEKQSPPFLRPGGSLSKTRFYSSSSRPLGQIPEITQIQDGQVSTLKKIQMHNKVSDNNHEKGVVSGSAMVKDESSTSTVARSTKKIGTSASDIKQALKARSGRIK